MISRPNQLTVLLALLFCAMFAILALPFSLWRAFWTQVRR